MAIGAGGAARASAQQLLVDETFRGASVASPDWRVGGRGFTTCLTASQNAAQVPIGGCPPGQFGVPAGGDAPGSGALRFTNRGNNQSGFLLWEAPLPLSNGVTATFDYFSYGGTGADGLSFFLVDGATTLTAPGAAGGSLGYAQKVGTGATDAPGVANGFLGLGLDEFGNYANDAEGRGTGCANRPPRTSRPDTVSVRGPGNGSTGYCLLPDDPPFPDPTFPHASRRITFGGGLDDPSAPNRNAGTVRNRVQVTVNPTTRRIAVSLDVGDGVGLRPIIDSPLPPIHPRRSSSASPPRPVVRRTSTRSRTCRSHRHGRRAGHRGLQGGGCARARPPPSIPSPSRSPSATPATSRWTRSRSTIPRPPRATGPGSARSRPGRRRATPAPSPRRSRASTTSPSPRVSRPRARPSARPAPPASTSCAPPSRSPSSPPRRRSAPGSRPPGRSRCATPATSR